MKWIKSSRCDTGSCVEVAFPVLGNVLVRNSTDQDTILDFTAEEWDAFIAGAKSGEFE
jgi:hypothetical protein